MKTFIAKLKRDDGFTLVELMVVVAIIGVLSAVAIPNFKKYQAKAKMSEGKLQLSSIYTAETSFYADFNIYHTCLDYMGFNPFTEAASRYYAVGFGAGADGVAISNHAAAVNSGLNGTICPATTAAVTGTAAAGTWWAAGKSSAGVVASTQDFLDNSAIGTQANAATSTFVASAGGVISSDAAYNTESTASMMTINQNKVLSTVRNGY